MPQLSHDALGILEILTGIISAVITSSGFWIFVEKRRGNRALERKLMIGLAHDRIVSLSIEFIRRGWVSHDEYENLYNFLYIPYKEMGANGSAERLMDEVKNLPLLNKPNDIYEKKGENRDS